MPRALSETHRNGLRTLWKNTWTATYSGVFDDKAFESLTSTLDDRELSSMLSGDDVRIILAHLDDIIIGSAVFKEVGAITYLWGMYVLPEYQRQNIGCDLIRLMVDAIENSTEVHIYVLETSMSAIRFYGKMGFIEVSRENIQLSPGLIVHSVLKSVKLDRLRAILIPAGTA